MTIVANLPASVARSGIHREPVTPEFFRLLHPLMEANHAAAGVDAPLNLDLWLIQGMQPRVWVVWHEGRPVGYCAHIVAPHLFTGELTATCAAIYVRPNHRAKVRKMLDHIEADLRAADVAVINYSVPHLSKAGAFLEKFMGYRCAELVMCKRLGD